MGVPPPDGFLGFDYCYKWSLAIFQKMSFFDEWQQTGVSGPSTLVLAYRRHRPFPVIGQAEIELL